MQHGEIGRYEATVAGEEPVRAFVPAPLPPDPALSPDGPLQQTLEAATLALGRLDAVPALLPDAAWVLYSCVCKEAVLSSRLEGTRSPLSDLLLFELQEAPGVPLDDVLEVSNYETALDHGLRRLTEGFPLSNRLIRETHGGPLSRGAARRELQRSRNRIGGSLARPRRLRAPAPPRRTGLHGGPRTPSPRRRGWIADADSGSTRSRAVRGYPLAATDGPDDHSSPCPSGRC